MIEINLLPKEYRKKGVSLSFGKSGLYVVAVVAGLLLMFVGITLFQMHQLASLDDNIARANQRAAMLQKDIQVVDALNDIKTKITKRMAAVERLDGHRSAWVRILQDLAANVPQFVWLGQFSEEKLVDSTTKAKPGETVANRPAPVQDTATAAPTPIIRKAEVEGYAFTLNALAAFMIKMIRSDYFEDIELVSTDEVTLEDHRAYNFVLSCSLHYLSDEELQRLIAQSEAETSVDETTSHKRLN